MQLPRDGDEMLAHKGIYMSSMQGSIATNRGFTVLELMITTVILAIGVALAVPTYTNVMQRRETTAQAEGLAAFMSFAQSEAIKYNQLISVHLTWTDEKDWCIGAVEGKAPCDCEDGVDDDNYCSLNEVEKIMRSPAETKAGMTTAIPDRTLVFDPVRGTMTELDLATNHAAILTSDNENWSLQVGVEVTGRIHICNPDPTKSVPGYPAC